jgi:hypothetical protein
MKHLVTLIIKSMKHLLLKRRRHLRHSGAQLCVAGVYAVPVLRRCARRMRKNLCHLL